MSFKRHLEGMSFESLIPLWNEWCAECGQDGAIYDSIEEFAELYGEDGLELARKVFFGDVKNWHDRVYLDGYANLRSCWSVESSPIDLGALAEWLEEVGHEVFTEWKDEQPTFEEWLEDTYSPTEIFALWSEYMWEEHQCDDLAGFDFGALGAEIEARDGDEYLAYMKETFE